MNKRKLLNVTLAVSLSAVVIFAGFKVFTHGEAVPLNKSSESMNVDNIANVVEAKPSQGDNNSKKDEQSGHEAKVEVSSNDKQSIPSTQSEDLKKQDAVKNNVVEKNISKQEVTKPSNNNNKVNNSSENVQQSTENTSDKKEEQAPSQPSTTDKPSTPNTSNTTNVNVSGLDPLPTKYSISVSNSQEQIILDLLNEKRRQAGLKELTMDNTLVKVARYKSNHMIQYDYFNHASPQGEMWYDWLRKIGYSNNGTAENIAYNYSGGKDLFNQWWNSQGHRNNMMNPSYTKIGIGVVYNKDQGIYMGTQNFSN